MEDDAGTDGLGAVRVAIAEQATGSELDEAKVQEGQQRDVDAENAFGLEEVLVGFGVACVSVGLSVADIDRTVWVQERDRRADAGVDATQGAVLAHHTGAALVERGAAIGGKDVAPHLRAEAHGAEPAEVVKAAELAAEGVVGAVAGAANIVESLASDAGEPLAGHCAEKADLRVED